MNATHSSNQKARTHRWFVWAPWWSWAFVALVIAIPFAVANFMFALAPAVFSEGTSFFGFYAAFFMLAGILLLPVSAVSVPVLIVVFMKLAVARVTVGPDGLFIFSMLQKQFISFREIAGISRPQVRGGIRLHLSSGLEIRLASALQRKRYPVYTELQTALTRFERFPAESEHELLSNTDRDVDAWFDRLRALAVGSGREYRRACWSRTQLWALADNPSVGSDQRAAAALLLSTEASDEDRCRFRMIANATANPVLRDVFASLTAGKWTLNDPDVRGYFRAIDSNYDASRGIALIGARV